MNTLQRPFSSIEPLRLKLDYYARHLQGTPSRLLDVGCGNGGFLLRAREMGWKAEGCDPDPQAVQTCRNLGLQARPRLSHKKLTCLSVEIKVSGESINLSIQA